MRTILGILALALACLSPAQYVDYGMQSGFNLQTPWATLFQGQMSPWQGPGTHVIQSQAQWETYWRRLNSGFSGFSAVPMVADWNEHQVIAIHAGPRPSAGYSIFVETVVPYSQNLWQVLFDIVAPPYGSINASVMTSPYVVIRVPRWIGVPVFVQSPYQYNYPWQGVGCGQSPCTCGRCSRPVYMVGGSGYLIPYANTGKGKKCCGCTTCKCTVCTCSTIWMVGGGGVLIPYVPLGQKPPATCPTK